MPSVFKYVAINNFGGIVNGFTTVSDDKALSSELTSRGLTLQSIEFDLTETVKTTLFVRHVSKKKVLEFMTYLQSMINMGINTKEAIELMRESMEDKTMSSILTSLADDMSKGYRLSEALARSQRFPEMFVSNIKTGEESGSIEKTLPELISYYEAEIDFNRQLQKSMTYPILTFLMAIGVLLAVFYVMIPKIRKLAKVDQLEGLAKYAILASDFLISHPLFLPFAVCVFIIGMIILVRTGMYNSLPVLGDIAKNKLYSSFFMGLVSFQKNGMTAPDAVEEMLSHNKALRMAGFQKVSDMLKQGQPISESIGLMFPNFKLVKTALKIGEKSGGIDIYFQQLAVFFRKRTEDKFALLITLSEPIAIVVVGVTVVIVGLIMYSVMYGSVNV